MPNKSVISSTCQRNTNRPGHTVITISVESQGTSRDTSRDKIVSMTSNSYYIVVARPAEQDLQWASRTRTVPIMIKMRALISVHQYGSSLICVIAGPLSIAAILRIFLVEPCRRFLRSLFRCAVISKSGWYILIAIAVGTISPRRQESHPAHFHPPLNTSGIIIHR